MAISAKFIADFESFYEAVEKADVQLKGLETGASRVSASLNKMADSLSGRKVIQDATLMATAVEKIGGVSKLTANELQRLGSQASEAIEKMQKNGIKEIPKNLQDIADAASRARESTSGLGAFFGELGEHVAATAAGFVCAQAVIGGVEKAFDGLTNFVKESVQAYAEAESASRRLSVAVQTQGLGIPHLVDQYHALSEAFQQNTAFSHDEITAAEALFVQLGNVGPDQMDKALRAATDLSAGLGIDLNSAVTLVAKAFEGQTSSLKRYGIVIDEARAKSEGITYVLDAIEAKVGGQAQAELDTYAGKIKQLGNAWEDFKQSVGESIVQDPALQAFLTHLQEGIKGSGEEAKGATTFITDWIASFANIDPVTQGLLRTLRDWITFDHEVEQSLRDVSHEIDAMGAQLPKLHDPIANAQKWLSDLKQDAKDFADATVKGWEDSDKAAKEAAKQHAAAIQQIEDALTHADIAKKARDLAEAFKTLQDQGKATPAVMKAVADEAADIITKGGRVPQVLQDLAIQMGALDSPAKQVALDFKDIGTHLHNEVSPAFDEVTRKIIEIDPKFQDVAERLNEIFSPNRTGLDKLFKDIGTGVVSDGQLAKQALDDIKAHQKAWTESIKETYGALLELPKQMSDVLAKMITGTEGFRAGWKSIWQSIVGDVESVLSNFIDTYLKAWFARLLGMMSGSSGSLSQGFTGSLLNSFTGGGAGGGGLNAGTLVSLLGGGGATFGGAGGLGAGIGATEGGLLLPTAGGGLGTAGVGVGGIGITSGTGSSAATGSGATAGLGGAAAIGGGVLGAGLLGGAVAGRGGAITGEVAAGVGGAALLGTGTLTAATIGGTLALGAATFGIGAAAVGAYALIKHLMSTAGRDAVQSFVDQNFSGWDNFHKRLDDMSDSLKAAGYDSEQLWVMLSQGVGRGNSKQAQQAIKEVTDAIQKAQAIEAQQAPAKAAQSAIKAYEDLSHGGTAAAEDVQAAWQRAEQAIAASGDTNLANLAKAHDAASQQIADLDAQIKSLQASVDAEAPEEVMGVIETQQRAQLDALKKERDAAAQHIEDINQQLEDSVQHLIDAFNKLPNEINTRVNVDVQTRFSSESPEPPTRGPDGASTGGYVTSSGVMQLPSYFDSGGLVRWQSRGTDTVPAMLTPGEIILNAAQQKTLASVINRAPDSRTESTVQITIHAMDGASVQRVVDSKPFAESLVRAFKRNLHGIAEAVA